MCSYSEPCTMSAGITVLHTFPTTFPAILPMSFSISGSARGTAWMNQGNETTNVLFIQINQIPFLNIFFRDFNKMYQAKGTLYNSRQKYASNQCVVLLYKYFFYLKLELTSTPKTITISSRIMNFIIQMDDID